MTFLKKNETLNPEMASLPQIKPIPKILIDARMIKNQMHGIAQHVMILSQELSQKKLRFEPIFLIHSPTFFQTSFKTIQSPVPFLHPLESFYLKKILKNNFQAYHSPSMSSIFNCPIPSMITLHDLNHLFYGSLLKKAYYQFLLKSFAQNSLIATVSSFSAQQISQWLKKDPSEILIVSNAVSIKKTIHKPNTKEPYFLCISNPKKHKNLEWLFKGYALFAKTNPHAPILKVTLALQKTAHEKIHCIGHPENLTELISGAMACFCPSLYEGFGLTPIEALLYGKPLVVSDIPAHKEGLQDAKEHEVLWVDPFDTPALVEAFKKAAAQQIPVASKETQDKIQKRFELKKLGQNYIHAYEKILKIT